MFEYGVFFWVVFSRTGIKFRDLKNISMTIKNSILENFSRSDIWGMFTEHFQNFLQKCPNKEIFWSVFSVFGLET